jgi:hypothetical protein
MLQINMFSPGASSSFIIYDMHFGHIISQFWIVLLDDCEHNSKLKRNFVTVLYLSYLENNETL